MTKRILALAGVLSVAFSATGDDLVPVVRASIEDSPWDGNPDSFAISPFEGLVRRQDFSRENRAIQEFDVSGIGGGTVISATLSGRVSVNNSFDNGPRTFDFVLYAGNGVADLSDYNAVGTVVGSGSYHPPNDTSFTYSFDVAAAVQSLIDGGATHIGLRCEGTSSPNFPNILSESESVLSIEVDAACIADWNGDGNVLTSDFVAYLNDYNAVRTGGTPVYGDPDIAAPDGTLNTADFLAFLNAYTSGCP